MEFNAVKTVEHPNILKMYRANIDRNSYYGGESVSINLTNLFEKFGPGQQVP